MSGGFFRGTSSDQDTRFSNKQAKLMKSQKFPPELEHLVDITKVKMDVMKPWIAHRVTELLGFEDEVLINFIYGLLDGKVVNGKEIQISITGFMEKNTSKFMKELWTLLLSAEKNASGVPQQFLDAKEEETRKKKAESDMIIHEIQKRKEKAQELEQEKADKMDGSVDTSLRQHQPRESITKLSADEKEASGRNGSRGRIRETPSRSNSGSFSHSRSRSEHRSRSVSGSPRNRRSDSAERVHRSPRRRSPTPHRRDSPQRSFSPSRRRTSHYRQRFISPSRRRSPSPIRRRLRRSRSPVRRRSRSPLRRRSRTPPRCRSRTPLRRRSPVRHRSRSPIWRRSPFRRRSRSPVWRRLPSPVRGRSPSPFRRGYRKSPSSPRRTSPSPVHRKQPIPSRRISRTPVSQSSSPRVLSPQSPIPQARDSRDGRSPKRQSSPVEPLRNRIRTQEQSSPVRQTTQREIIACSPETRKGSSLERRTHKSSQRSPQRDQNDWDSLHRGASSLSHSLYNSPSGSESPQPSRKKSLSRDKRASSPHEGPRREPVIDDIRPSPPRKPKVHEDIPVGQQVEKAPVSSEAEDTKGKSSGKKLMTEESKVAAQKANYIVKGGGRHESQTLNRMSTIAEERNNRGSDGSDYGASDKHRAEVGEKRKHKRSKRQESDDGHGSDSQLERRKETKRRRKEEKKLRKEERRRRREERRRRKDERRVEKIKLKAVGTVSSPSDFAENHQGYRSDGAHAARRDSLSSDNEEESEQKKLEIALREKALEKLRAKKGAEH